MTASQPASCGPSLRSSSQPSTPATTAGFSPSRLGCHGRLPCKTRPALLRMNFILASIVLAARPAGWMLYNAVVFGDWLDFMRGPYSARAIEAAHRLVRCRSTPRLAQSLGCADLLHQSRRNGCSAPSASAGSSCCRRLRHRPGHGSNPASKPRLSNGFVIRRSTRTGFGPSSSGCRYPSTPTP
jgi:hypothetical protein